MCGRTEGCSVKAPPCQASDGDGCLLDTDDCRYPLHPATVDVEHAVTHLSHGDDFPADPIAQVHNFTFKIGMLLLASFGEVVLMGPCGYTCGFCGYRGAAAPNRTVSRNQ